MSPMARELRSLRKGLDKLREEVRAVLAEAAPRDGAVKRAVAAKLMGVSVGKLDTLVKKGKVATTEDTHLVPMAEVRRYCAPRPKRRHKPAIGHRARSRKRLAGQTDEAFDSARQMLRNRGAP